MRSALDSVVASTSVQALEPEIGKISFKYSFHFQTLLSMITIQNGAPC